MDSQQLTHPPQTVDKDNEELQKLDLAENMGFVPPNLAPGEKVYYWQDDSSKTKLGKKSGSWIKATIVAVKGSMATINNGTSVLQVNVTKLRRPLEEIDFEGISDSRERDEVTVLYSSSMHGTLDILELFSESTFLSAACASRGLRTGPPVDLKKREQSMGLCET